jgi:hypothetical protein
LIFSQFWGMLAVARAFLNDETQKGLIIMNLAKVPAGRRPRRPAPPGARAGAGA